MTRSILQESCGIVPVYVTPEGEPRYLLLHSGLVRNPRARWEFPKGSMEAGETVLQTALRECSEETGLPEVEVVQSFTALDGYVFRREGRRIQKRVVYLIGFVADPAAVRVEPDGREHVRDAKGIWSKWLSQEEAMKTLYHEGQRAVLACAAAHLRGFGLIEARARRLGPQ